MEFQILQIFTNLNKQFKLKDKILTKIIKMIFRHNKIGVEIINLNNKKVQKKFGFR